MAYCIYLRKSRADLEAEARGEGETLARHERALKDLAMRRGYPIEQVYREIVSGESIAGRPQMRQLLADVAARRYQGVLCMEVERLARGDTSDQATVANAFKFSDTLIITPVKTYDPNNPMDEEYFEFSLFMSRREYKTIVRRMQTGRNLASAEGKYVASRDPYGYHRIRRADGAWTLEVDPQQAEIVRQVFYWYTHGEGGTRIASRLNAMGVPTAQGKRWAQHTVSRIVHNPIYLGQITWNRRVQTVVGLEGSAKQYKRLPNSNATRVQGLHPPIIDQATFDAANRTGRESSMPVRADCDLANPLAGLVRCACCGHVMSGTMGSMRPDGTRYPYRITCRTDGCSNYGCALETVETLVLDELKRWSVECANAPAPRKHEDDTLRIARTHLEQLQSQASKLCDFLERGIYSEDLYMQRSVALAAQITSAQEELARLEAAQSAPDIHSMQTAIAPLCAEAVAAYRAATTAKDKNAALRRVIDHIVFRKTKRGNNRNDGRDSITISIFPFGSSLR